MTFAPDGDGWIAGPYAVSDLGDGPIEVVRHYVAQAGHEDSERERVWHRPIRPLPTVPGYYIAKDPSYGGTVVVELLGSPAGQWVDAGDRTYLQPDAVRDLGPLIRLAPVAEVLDAVDTASDGIGEPGESTWIVSAAIADVERQYGVQR